MKERRKSEMGITRPMVENRRENSFERRQRKIKKKKN